MESPVDAVGVAVVASHPLAVVVAHVQRRREKTAVLEVHQKHLASLVAEHIAPEQILVSVHQLARLVANQLLVARDLRVAVL